MAGRPKKLGNKICRDPRCVGYSQLGRYRTKPTRSRPRSRYHARVYFRHNDSAIPEHYYDQFIKIKQNNASLVNSYDRLGHEFKILARRYRTYQLEKEDHDSLEEAFEWHTENVIRPTQVITDIHRGVVQVPLQAEFVSFLKDKVSRNVMLTNNRLLHEIIHIYHKYERPRRLERNKKRNMKLRESYNFPKPTLPNLINPDSRDIT